MYLLDTNICIELLKGNRSVRAHVEEVGPRDCYISEITVAELYYGAYKGEHSFEKRQDIRFLLELFDL
ncbi:MAG: PIN domain-containing protein, partial [Bacteroidales bacterium]|nr:PIN domain-containing protein [Bacteroidales bacterium]